MRRDVGVGGLLVLLSLILLWQTRDIPHPPFVPIGPAFYPRVILAVLLALSLALLVSGLRSPRASRGDLGVGAWLARHRLIVGTFLLFGLYVLAMPVLGYLVATALFALAAQWLLGRRTWRQLPGVLAVALGTAVGTWVVFERYLHVLFPRGILLP